MSMISAQADKLRERAKVLRKGRWSDGEEDARLMEYAADLILELRDDLQRANAENAKLIVKLNAEHIVRQNVEIENVKLREENAHLQSLVKQFYWCTKSMREALRQCKDTKPYYLEALNDTLAKVYDQMVELGIEVG